MDFPFCDNNNEDDWHVIFRFPETNKCWRAAGLSNIIEQCLHVFHCINLIILDICSRGDRKIVGRVVVIMDVMWKNRNDILWNNKHEELSKVGWLAFHHGMNGFRPSMSLTITMSNKIC